ncbi:DNA primase [bacterium]|nr:DNA primase [bacterium]
MPISEETVNQVREQSDIVEVVSEYVSLKRRGGRNFTGLCPFHQEKTPSFSVNPDLQIFKCFGCGKGGNVYTFIMEMERIEFPDAVRHLAERIGIKIEGDRSAGQNEALYQANEIAFKLFRHRLTKVDAEDAAYARDYLRKRGIDEKLEAKFELGVSPPDWDTLIKLAGKRGLSGDVLERAGLAIRRESGGWYDRFRGRLMFPIRNAGGKVVAFGGRVLKEDPDKPGAKYINSPETSIYHKGKLVYGIRQARDAMRQGDEAILVEGYTDLIALHRVGFDHAVATLGTALTGEQASLIKRFASRVTLLYDADTAGNTAAYRGADILIAAGLEVRIAQMPEGEDPDTLIQSGGQESMEGVLERALPLIDFKIDYFKRQGKMDTPQGRSEVIHSLVETIRRIPERITRQFYAHEVSTKVDIDERLLARELNLVQPARVIPFSRQDTQVQATKYDRLLEEVIKVLIENPHYASDIFNNLTSGNIIEHPLKRLYQHLEGLWIEGVEVKQADLFNHFADDQEIRDRISLLLSREKKGLEKLSEDMDEKNILEVINRTPILMKQFFLKTRVQEIREQLKTGAGMELIEEYDKIKKEIDEIRFNLPNDL